MKTTLAGQAKAAGAKREKSTDMGSARDAVKPASATTGKASARGAAATALKVPARTATKPVAKPVTRSVPKSAPKSVVKAAGKAVARPAGRAPRGLASDGLEDIRDAVSRLKRERIIAAAVDQFYTHGLNNTTLDAVADKMNVTKAFIYSHFKSKNELLGEICARGIRSSLDALNRVVATDATAVEKVEALVRQFMQAVLENQASIAIYTREEKHLGKTDRDAINEMRREFDRKLCGLLEEGVATGEFQVEDVHLASLAIGGIVSWSYVWYRPGGRLSKEDTAAKITNMVLAMIQAKPLRRKRGKA